MRGSAWKDKRTPGGAGAKEKRGRRIQEEWDRAANPQGLEVRGEGLGGGGLKGKRKCVSWERQYVRRQEEAWGRKLHE